MESNFTITKEHEGEIIYGVGTGNNVRYSQPDKPIMFKVVKVKRKYVEMIQDAFGRSNNYCPKTGATQRDINDGYGGNAGWIFFETKQDVEDHYKRVALVSKINRLSDWRTSTEWKEKLSLEQLQQIIDIVESCGVEL